MGRVKLPISRILNNTNRQVTYSKRRNGILKKAYEIAVLCDIDIALIMISPSGRITFFSGTRRIEDVMLQFFNLNDEEIELDQDSEGSLVNDKEGVISTLMRLKTEATANQSPKDLSTHVEEIISLQHQLELAKEQLRAIEPDPQKCTSFDELESCEEKLSKTLSLIEQREKNLLSNHSSSYQETVEQIHSVVRYIWNAQAESTMPPTIVNPDFSSWSEHVNRHDLDGPKYMYMGSDTSPIFHESQSSATVIGVESEPTMYNDKQSPEECKVRSLSEECLQQWHNSVELYPALMPQEMSHSLNEMHGTDAASIITPLQCNQVESPSQLS